MLTALIDAPTEAQVRDWLTEYVIRPHPDLGRRGAICPFVRPALRRGTVVIRAVAWEPEFGAQHLERIANLAMIQFRDLTQTTTNPELLALVVALPAMPREHWPLIDAVHHDIKAQAVQTGLMVGQFHPQCPAPAVHNPDFPVNRSPVPLLVIRQMAVHDILFLAEDPVWFRAYRERFGTGYNNATVREPHLRTAYDRALARYR